MVAAKSNLKGQNYNTESKSPPLITYISTFIYVPKHIINSIDKILYDFIWKNKHHVKKTTLITSPSHGRLKIPHAELVIKSNKLNFLKRIIDRTTNCNKTAAVILKKESVENFLKYKKRSDSCSHFQNSTNSF